MRPDFDETMSECLFRQYLGQVRKYVMSGKKTKSPGQILGNSCLHFRGQIGDPILMKFDQNVVLTISRPSSNMSHKG